MKLKLTLLFLFLLISGSYSQNSTDKTTYLDSLMAETSEGNHKFIKVVKDFYVEKSNYKIYTYYKNNVLKEETTHDLKEFGRPNGEETTYFENGKKQKIVNFKNGFCVGKVTTWYDSGNLQSEGVCVEDNNDPRGHFIMNQFWSEDNKQMIIDGNGSILSKINPKYIETGEYKDGYKNGIFEGKNLNNKIIFIENYKNGKFISGTTIADDDSKIVYSEVDKRPNPKKGIKDFYKFIGKKFKSSDEAVKNKVNGKIVIKFVVDKEGDIVEPIVAKSLGYGLDEEAIRVLLLYGSWIPGEQRGVKVKVLYILPISIKTTN